MIRTFEPIPSILAPIWSSMRARSWTCGSDAALWMTVVPGVSAAAISAFSVPITDGSSMKKSHARRPPGGATIVYDERVDSTTAPSARKASRCGSSRRRPITSPPGGGMCTRPEAREQRPGTEERRADALRQHAVHFAAAQIVGAKGDHVVIAPLDLDAQPLEQREHRVDVADARDVAHDDLLVGQERGGERGQRAVLVAGGNDRPGERPAALDDELLHEARVPVPSASFSTVQPTRQEAWELVEEWVASDSLRKHLLGVEAAMVGYARKWGEDEEMYAVTGLLHDLDYDRYPDLDTGHPRHALKLFEEKGYPQELIDAVAGHATFLGVPRETQMAKTLYAVDELSGFVAACALVRPTGIHGLTPKSVKKKLKQPSFAAGVNRDEVREGAEDLGVEFDEHVAFVIAAMEERADELGLSK